MIRPLDYFLSNLQKGLAPGGHVHVLVVDDDQYDRYFARRILEQKGIRVSEAVSGPAGLQSIERERPDMVLLDLHLRGMHGPEVLKEIRAQWPDLPVAILSGHTDGPLLEAAMKHAPNIVLSKVTLADTNWQGLAESVEPPPPAP